MTSTGFPVKEWSCSRSRETFTSSAKQHSKQLYSLAVTATHSCILLLHRHHNLGRPLRHHSEHPGARQLRRVFAAVCPGAIFIVSDPIARLGSACSGCSLIARSPTPSSSSRRLIAVVHLLFFSFFSAVSDRTDLVFQGHHHHRQQQHTGDRLARPVDAASPTTNSPASIMRLVSVASLLLLVAVTSSVAALTGHGLVNPQSSCNIR